MANQWPQTAAHTGGSEPGLNSSTCSELNRESTGVIGEWRAGPSFFCFFSRRESALDQHGRCWSNLETKGCPLGGPRIVVWGSREEEGATIFGSELALPSSKMKTKQWKLIHCAASHESRTANASCAFSPETVIRFSLRSRIMQTNRSST